MESKTENLVRLNTLLQEYGVSSRRKADELIAEGKVRVDGKTVTTLGTKVPPDAQIFVQGKLLVSKPQTATYIFYKPDLYITSRSDDTGKLTIYDLPKLKRLPKNVQPVGRLDFRSEGLLILTNDGDLANCIMHPRFSIVKKYACLINHALNVTEMAQLKKGFQLEDGFAKPIKVKLGNREKLGSKQPGQWIEIWVDEGRNRLIRRLFSRLDRKVIKLVRIAIGNIEIDTAMKPGDLRPLNSFEQEALNKIKNQSH